MTDLQKARQRRGWSQSELIGHLRAAARSMGRELPEDSTLRGMVSRWERGHHKPHPMYGQLFDAVYDARATEGHGAELALRSHQFIPAWLGPESVRRAVELHCMDPDLDHWTEPHRCALPAPAGAASCDLYVWPHGVAILHVVDDLIFPSLAGLAVWRQRTYDDRLAWATELLQEAAPAATAAYVLSLYWMLDTPWAGDDHSTAMRLLCMPRVLVSKLDGGCEHQHQAETRLTEDALLASRWDNESVQPFGVDGTSAGYASWSGVVYQAREPSRALEERALIDYELGLQATWAYCGHINGEIEQSRDPIVADDWGWRYLRSMRLRLANPRPQEPGQHRAMREAILQTSGLLGHLDQAIETLRDVER